MDASLRSALSDDESRRLCFTEGYPWLRAASSPPHFIEPLRSIVARGVDQDMMVGTLPASKS